MLRARVELCQELECFVGEGLNDFWYKDTMAVRYPVLLLAGLSPLLEALR